MLGGGRAAPLGGATLQAGEYAVPYSPECVVTDHARCEYVRSAWQQEQGGLPVATEPERWEGGGRVVFRRSRERPA